MKKQIVITLTEVDPGFTAEIYGQIDNKKTDKITGYFATKDFAINCISCESNIKKIEQWMEQIS